MPESTENKMMRTRCRLMTRQPWYGHMAMSIEWKQSPMDWVDDPAKRTLGMRINSQGIVQCFYNPEWVEATPMEKIFGVIEHAINHLVRLHTVRHGGREVEAWDLATDMAVNGRKADPHIGYRSEGGSVILPYDDMVFTPDTWPRNDSAEKYYEMLIESNQQDGGDQDSDEDNDGDEEDENEMSGMGGDGDGDEEDEDDDGNSKGSGQSSKEPGHYQYGNTSGRALDDHQTWDQSEISQDEARQIVSSMVRDATEKSQGHTPGHLSQILESLQKPIIRWRELIRQYLGRYVGNRRQTFSRTNRRSQAFGDKGVSHHAAATVQVVVDTSGSISTDELEQFFAEIEAIAYRAKVFVLQWDAEFQGYNRYRRNDWKKITVNGRGGTNMADPIDWLESNTSGANVWIMLTDGYCNWPSRRQVPFICVITNDNTEGPEWGTVVCMNTYE